MVLLNPIPILLCEDHFSEDKMETFQDDFYVLIKCDFFEWVNRASKTVSMIGIEYRLGNYLLVGNGRFQNWILYEYLDKK